uniref:Serine-rich adhesin for platelets-like n=1 Tax=Hirondellea gigas TaxID=1518452 RepID=A0A6A7FV92_9CRUS
MPLNEKDDPGVCNPAFTKDEDDQEEDEDDEGKEKEENEEDEEEQDNEDEVYNNNNNSSNRNGRNRKRKKKERLEVEGSNDESDSSKGSVEDSPPSTPRIRGFISLRNSPTSHRGGIQSGRSSLSSVRKGILKKSGSCATINLELAQQNGLSRSYQGSIGDSNDLTDGSRPECLPNDPQRSISRVKFILDSGKPDNITGSYDDIRIEMIEKDRSDRIDRGKGHEGSGRGLSKSGKKCLIFCAGLALLTVAVILGSFAG